MLTDSLDLVRLESAVGWLASMLVSAGHQRDRTEQIGLPVTEICHSTTKRANVTHLTLAHPWHEVKRHVELLGIKHSAQLSRPRVLLDTQMRDNALERSPTHAQASETIE
jgi:hypothetical protein